MHHPPPPSQRSPFSKAASRQNPPALRPSAGAGDGQEGGKFRVLAAFQGGGGGTSVSQPAARREEDAVALGAGSRLGTFSGDVEAGPPHRRPRGRHLARLRGWPAAKKAKKLLLLVGDGAWGGPHVTPRGFSGVSSHPCAHPCPEQRPVWRGGDSGVLPGDGGDMLPRGLGWRGGGTGGSGRRSVMQAGVGRCSWEPSRPRLRF